MNFTNASSSNPSKKIKLTIIPPRQLFVNISSDEDITTTPSPTTTSSSPTPQMHHQKPHPLIKHHQVKTTHLLPFTQNFKFHHHLHMNPLLDNFSDVPHRPLNPQPLQSHPSLDITLSLSSITPLDHIHDTPSPPSPP
ncbi:hypothetical protein Tco_1323286 [Tanacetum coccineum]